MISLVIQGNGPKDRKSRNTPSAAIIKEVKGGGDVADTSMGEGKEGLAPVDHR